MPYESHKTYTHNAGLSCVFRQWRATHSHCRFLHGYALQVEITMGCVCLDERNWVADFGAFKPLKAWLEQMFDHKTVVAHDDPDLPLFLKMESAGLLQITMVEHVGCEAFAKLIHDHVKLLVPFGPHAFVRSVTVREHAGNAATYRE
jgi:6-pyruvoyltetrahydropterin/6-carboxytetrahydropterin synthase